MKEEFRFDGGRVALRHEGQMFDQKTGQKTEWGRGLKILGGSKPITLEAQAVFALIEALADDEVLEWLRVGIQKR